jgi:hypothetical protein
MAYMNQEKKKAINEKLQIALKAYPTVKCSLSVYNHSTISCRIKSGPKCLLEKDFRDVGFTGVNHYFINDNYKEEASAILNCIKDALNTGNFDESDSQTDYFCVGHYVDISVGSFEKPYVVV